MATDQKRKQNPSPTCTCGAYAFPHRKNSGKCRTHEGAAGDDRGLPCPWEEELVVDRLERQRDFQASK